MDFEIRFLSFYVIQVEGKDEQANKQFKHFQTLDTGEFEESELKDFLDGELKKSSNGKPTAIRSPSRCRRRSAILSSSPATSSIPTRITTCSTGRAWQKQKKTLTS